jgi:hypothetical protein
VRGPDGDAPRRPDPMTTNHRFTAWTGSGPTPARPRPRSIGICEPLRRSYLLASGSRGEHAS